jgi:5,5'-dehydrodivanillate O-demethylase oxygenase subunit
VPYVEVEMVDAAGNFTALNAITGQDVMAWVSQGPIVDRTRERLADSDRGVILYRKQLFEQLARVEAGLDPINTFRDPAENVCIDLPVPWDRGYAWGYAKDGSYVPGTVTAADPLPPHIKAEIEALYLKASTLRERELASQA